MTLPLFMMLTANMKSIIPAFPPIRLLRLKKFNISVTNCFDEYDRLLSGAKDKADKTAKKRPGHFYK